MDQSLKRAARRVGAIGGSQPVKEKSSWFGVGSRPGLCNAEGKRKPLNEVTYEFLSCQSGAVGVVVSHPLSIREALGSIPRLSIVLPSVVCIDFGANTGSCMLRLHSVTSRNLLIMYIARSLQLDCARKFLHAEITWISVRLVKNPGLFPDTAMWSSRERCALQFSVAQSPRKVSLQFIISATAV